MDTRVKPAYDELNYPAPRSGGEVYKRADALRGCDRKGGRQLFGLFAGPAGCVATGDTVESVEAEICDAIRFHIDGLKADGLPVAAPTSIADYVET